MVLPTTFNCIFRLYVLSDLSQTIVSIVYGGAIHIYISIAIVCHSYFIFITNTYVLSQTIVDIVYGGATQIYIAIAIVCHSYFIFITNTNAKFLQKGFSVGSRLTTKVAMMRYFLKFESLL